MSIVVVDGWWGSGKSTLKGLLDGHPSLLVSPIQDSVLGGFASDESKDVWMQHKDIEAYRGFLAGRTNYYRIEKYADWRHVVFQPDATTTHRLPFDFDFPSFDSHVKSKFLQSEEWRWQEYIQIFYHCFFEHWKGYSKASANPMWVTMEANKESTPELLLGSGLKFKFIYVDRATEGTIATRYARTPIHGFAATSNYLKSNLSDFIDGGEVWRITRKRQAILALQEAYPDNFKVIRLEDIVCNTENIARQLARFLEIPFIPIMLRFTYRGESFAGSEIYLGQLNDDYVEIFSENEIKLLRAEMKRSEDNAYIPCKVSSPYCRLRRFAKRLVHMK